MYAQLQFSDGRVQLFSMGPIKMFTNMLFYAHPIHLPVFNTISHYDLVVVGEHLCEHPNKRKLMYHIKTLAHLINAINYIHTYNISLSDKLGRVDRMLKNDVEPSVVTKLKTQYKTAIATNYIPAGTKPYDYIISLKQELQL